MKSTGFCPANANRSGLVIKMHNSVCSKEMTAVVVNDTSVDRHYGCFSVMSAISELLSRYGFNVSLYWPAHTDWKGSAAFDNAVSSADVVIVNGEGTIHHDRISGLRLLEIGSYVRSKGTPVALINAGWESNSAHFSELLKDFDLISARDTKSAELMRANGDSVRVVPDLSFWFAQTFYGSFNLEEFRGGHVGFTDSVDRFKSLFLDDIRGQCGGQTVPITYCQRGFWAWLRFLRGGVALKSDCFRLMTLSRLLKLRHALWSAGSPDFDRFIKKMASFDLIVSGRFHSCTLAIAIGVPLVAIPSNTSKIASVLSDIGVCKWRYDNELTPCFVQKAASKGWSPAEVYKIRKYLSDSVALTGQLFDDIRQLAKGEMELND